MQLLGGDADLSTETELLAVGERRRRVDHHRRGIDSVGKPLCGSHIAVTMASVCPLPYSLMWAIAASTPSTTATAMSIERYSRRRFSSSGSRCTVTPASCRAATSLGTASLAIAASTSSVSAAL